MRLLALRIELANVALVKFGLKPFRPLAISRFEAHTHEMTATDATIVFACLNCGAIYNATQHRGVNRHFGVFNCLACHTQVYAWHGAYDFLDWKVGLPAAGPYHPLARAQQGPYQRERRDE
jgi:hypothetical protein